MKSILMQLRQYRAVMSLLAFALLATPVKALQIQAQVVDLGGLFHYDVSVLNDDPIADLLVVSITDAPLNDALLATTLAPPLGFIMSYDTGLGIVDLAIDTTPLFPTGLTGLFSFDSMSSPDVAFTRFEATDLSGNLFTGTVNSQLTQAVTAPGPLALLLLGLALLAYKNRLPRPLFIHQPLAQ